MKRREDLKLIAYLFIFLGLLALGDALLALFRGEIQLSLGLLMFPAGLGLLQYKERWRTVALWILALNALALVTLIVLAYAVAPTFTVTIMSNQVEPASLGAIALIAGYATVIIVLLAWAFRVLTRKEVVQRFQETKA